MAMAIIRNSTGTGRQTTAKGPPEYFTGDVWADVAYADSSIWVGNVTFTPCAHTNWHTHERGQLLRILAGSGWICDKGGNPQRVNVGDTIWCPPGTTHWHGGDDGSYMTHLAIAFGKSEWLEPVSEVDYASKTD